MLATRVSIIAELILAAAATGLIAMTPEPARGRAVDPSIPHPAELRVVHVELMSAPHKPDCSLSGKRAALYRDRDFGAAALSLGTCRDADLMRALDRAYTIANAATADLADRLVAAQEAYAIDLAFGGVHSDELKDAEAMLAARRANQLVAR